MLLNFLLAAGMAAAVTEPAPDALSYFEGAWRCDGQFEPSKKPLASALVFRRDDQTGALLKHHRDLAPGSYLAEETWSFAKTANGWRASIADRFSGLRWYASPGWKDDRWTWSRQGAGEPDEQFVYRRVGPGTMNVEWWISRGGAPRVLGDALVCQKTPD